MDLCYLEKWNEYAITKHLCSNSECLNSMFFYSCHQEVKLFKIQWFPVLFDWDFCVHHLNWHPNCDCCVPVFVNFFSDWPPSSLVLFLWPTPPTPSFCWSPGLIPWLPICLIFTCGLLGIFWDLTGVIC